MRCRLGGYQGGYTGWVPRVAIPGYYPPTAQGGPEPAERAPEGLQGLEWVGSGTGACPCSVRRWAAPRYHPAGPVGLTEPSLYLGPLDAASGPITARFHLIPHKVSQNG